MHRKCNTFYICMCVHIYIYITFIFMCIFMLLCVFIYMYMHTHTHNYTYLCRHTHTHLREPTYVFFVCRQLCLKGGYGEKPPVYQILHPTAWQDTELVARKHCVQSPKYSTPLSFTILAVGLRQSQPHQIFGSRCCCCAVCLMVNCSTSSFRMRPAHLRSKARIVIQLYQHVNGLSQACSQRHHTVNK